mmetsp:Transcript_18069/g.55316  ORF Transcript_18069/g.55316 Transcript_18069/m.55316 type:complete len:282 (-) Transcript_18069:127-972(-)
MSSTIIVGNPFKSSACSSSSRPVTTQKLLSIATDATTVYFSASFDPGIMLPMHKLVSVVYHPRTPADYDPRLTRQENRIAQMDAILYITSDSSDTFNPAEWLPHMKSTPKDFALCVQATNSTLADAPVIGPDPRALYASDALNLTVFPAARTHRCGRAPTEQKCLDVRTVADYKKLGRFGDFTDHLAGGRLRFQDHIYYLQREGGNFFPVQRDFPCLTFPVRSPTTQVEKILTSQYDVISEVLDIPVSDTVNYFTCENNNHRSEPDVTTRRLSSWTYTKRY